MNTQYQKAFTLIELAVVLFIISLLLVGLLGPVGSQIESRERQETIDTMENIIESLYGFAAANGYLPCPDTDGDGLENSPVTAGTAICPTNSGEGWLPWQTLGLNVQGDVWGNRFKYRVSTPGYTVIDTGTCSDDAGATGDLDLCQSGDITIRRRGDDPSTGALETKADYVLAQQIPLVIVSHGRNSLGATTVNGAVLAATTAGTDENQNDDNTTNQTFYSRTYTEGAAGCADDTNEATFPCQFDDIVMWISPNILKNRMIKSEILP